jgi:predicted O-linked N-acetylglucosamine transferase (SPINDLY family)
MDLLEEAIKFHKDGFLEKAENIYQKIIKNEPKNFQAKHFLGIILFSKKKYFESIKLIKDSISINPENFSAYNNLGNVFKELKKYDEAINFYKSAIKLKENYAIGFYNLAQIYKITSNFKLALDFYNKAILFDKDFYDAYYNLAELHEILKNFNDATYYYNQLLKLKPDYPYLLGSIINLKLQICDWANFDESLKEIKDNIIKKKQVSKPLDIVFLFDSLELQSTIIKDFSTKNFPQINSAVKNTLNNDKIKIGYFSSDFNNSHPTGYLIPELFEYHNKTQFDLYVFYFGNKIDSKLNRIKKAATKFYNISSISDHKVAKFCNKINLDIAIDVNGLIKNCRPNIFALKAAPIQINYLAFPNTMGINYINYIIADKILIPNQSQKFYSEKIIYLPNSYQISDQKRDKSDNNLIKKHYNLPEDKFIFCCFNNIIKINPYIFNIWMNILKRNINSVLWLLSDNTQVINNLKSEAKNRNINPERLIFAKRVNISENLNRYKLADLFLDTFPCSAHTTANDVLWAGTPLLTLAGESFASRVSASLLSSMNIKELITYSEKEYEDLAVKLSNDNKKIIEIKQRLTIAKGNTTLFNSETYTKNIELAYLEIWNNFRKGLKPKNVYIE